MNQTAVIILLESNYHPNGRKTLADAFEEEHDRAQ